MKSLLIKKILGTGSAIVFFLELNKVPTCSSFASTKYKNILHSYATFVNI